jgi:hypothetical protein
MERKPLTKAELKDADPNCRRLHKVWAALPDEPTPENELEDKIVEIAGCDHANAGVIRTGLNFVGALQLVMVGSLRCVQPAEVFVPWNPVTVGSEAHQSQQRSETEERHKAREKAEAARFENSQFSRERREMIALIDQRIDARLAALDGTTAPPEGRSSTASIKERLGRLRAA